MAFLQRHGESVTNLTQTFTCRRLDPELTEVGRAQIAGLAPYYSAKGIDRIFSSPSRRAVESAVILASVLGVAFSTSDCLLEVDVGSLEGKSEQDHESLGQFYAVINDWLILNRNTSFQEGESFEDVKTRLDTIKTLFASERTVIVGHSVLFAVFLGTRDRPFAKVEELFLPRGGLAIYDHRSGDWKIETGAEHVDGPPGQAIK